MIFSLDQIKKFYPCKEGLELFKHYLNGAEQTADIEWNEAAQGMLLASDLRHYFGWLVRQKILPIYRLDRRSFCGVNLYGVDFARLDLTHCDFSESVLGGADLQSVRANHATFVNVSAPAIELSGASLRHATFKSAHLEGGEFVTSSLIWANFRGANLKYTSFVDAELHGANFSYANLCHARFNESVKQTSLFRGAIVDEHTDFAGYMIDRGAIMKESKK